ncbi:MAG: hypothetical protein H0T79_09850 [Deltaproteobacteria bacterium]|nr:hypothetical protein [Deltaproteobacteria bacterium]
MRLLGSTCVVLLVAIGTAASAEPRISDDDAATLLYGAPVTPTNRPVVCGTPATEPEPGKPAQPGVRLHQAERGLVIECLIAQRFAADKAARDLALALFRTQGHVVGVGPDEIMDGGYRGKIHLVPQLPTGAYRKQLVWTSLAMTSIDTFFTQLFATTKLAPNYRWRALGFRFVRSVGKHTPSAYAMGSTITYNVEGSLLTSEAGVRETLFHEIFHLNDLQASPKGSVHRADWSAKTLKKDYDAIVAKCGTKVACLAPYAPNSTMVRGGTYYAFQQNNGEPVHEYAAELAVRYWKEQTEMLRTKKLARPAFKCGPGENARSWKALVDEFFGGRDLVPECP